MPDAATSSGPQLRVLVSAYGCEPGVGSEPGAGWAWVVELSRKHDVVVMTRANNRERIEAHLGVEPRDGPLFIWLDLPRWMLWLKRRGMPAQLYYLVWQALAGRRGKQLHRALAFDIVHHLTWAVDWLPAGVLRVDAPVRIWGPVGGSTSTPCVAYRWLGGRGVLQEISRELITRPLRLMFGIWSARRASLVLLQNEDGLPRFAKFARCMVEPNVVTAVDADSRLGPRSERTAVYVGRLLPLKGVAIALAALAHPAAADWRLRIVGDGPDRHRLRRLARRLGVAPRVDWLGWVSRSEALEAIASAAVLVLPSTHEAAGFVLAEASSLGTPVICLDHGGPKFIVDASQGIRLPLGRDVAAQMAHSLVAAAAMDVQPATNWTGPALGRRLEAIYDAALGTKPAVGQATR